ncbi:MAG: cardiolipin synthase [Lentisphaeria bacterium]|nr:cardiolipin synthase [Lentisphaeria bacterium]
MEPINFLFALLYLFVSVHIITNKHDTPTSAIMWLAILYIFGWVGVSFYLIFGINRLNNNEIKIAKFYQGVLIHSKQVHTVFSEFTRSCNPFYSSGSKDLSIVLDRLLPDLPALSGNAIKLYNDGDEAYPEMLASIQNAKHTIHLCYYIISADNIGQSLIMALNERAHAGVKVRVIYDQVGSGWNFSKIIKRLGKTKSPNLLIRPFKFLNLLAPYRLQLRNHRKLMVIDGHTVYSGGLNISSVNSSKYNKLMVHDINCKIEGPSCGHFQLCFLIDWFYANKKIQLNDLVGPGYFHTAESKGDNVLRICQSGPGQNTGASASVFMAATQVARKKFWIMTPYFTPGPEFISSLILTAARGVDVRIILPCSSDHFIMNFAIKSYYTQLLEGGVKIYEKQGTFNHSKAMLVDDEWTLLGSSNCDNRSFNLNFELDFVCESGPFVDVIHRQFIDELSQSLEVDLMTHLRRGRVTQFLENVISLFSPVL